MFVFLVGLAFQIPFIIFGYLFSKWFYFVGLIIWLSPLPDIISVRHLKKKIGDNNDN